MRITLVIQQKQEVVKQAIKEPTWSQGKLASWATSRFKLKRDSVSRTTVCKILKNVDAIMAASGHSLSRKSSRAAQLPDAEKALVGWLDFVNSSEFSVTGLMIRERAEQFAQQLQVPDGSFRFSQGWLWRFQKRYKIKSLLDHGEAGSCDPEQVVEGRREAQDITVTFEKQDVYNLDEMAFNYCAHRRRSLRRRGTKRGRKLNKQRLTVLLATNANGTDKLPLYFVGTAMKPHCFEGKPAAHHGIWYGANKKAWMTSVLFREWMHKMDGRFREQERHVLFLMDNVSSHKTEELELTNITVQKLTPNTTAHTQPLDAGIIAAFKNHFRRQQCRHALACIREKKDPYKISILTAMQWAKKA